MPANNPGTGPTQYKKKRPPVSPDAQDRATEARRRASPQTPDQADRSRSAPQQVRDRAAVATSVASSREKVIAKENRGSGTRAVAKVLHVIIDTPTSVQAPRVHKVTPEQAKALVQQGRKVRVLTPAEANDIGATLQASIGGGTTGLVRGPLATASGIAKDPKHALPATARGFRDALTGIPSSIAALITDPTGTAKGVLGDYDRRYSGLNDPGGMTRMANRVSKEGAAPELLDAAILATGAGSAAGRALTIPARAGQLGKTLEHVATAERPAKRVSGGKAVAQEKSENLIVAAAQTARDTRRVKKNQKQVARADEQAQRVDAIKAEAAAHGEIPVKGRAAARLVSREKGRDLNRMKREQRTEVDKGTRRNLAGLSKRERNGFKFAMQLGIPGDAKVARTTLEKRLADITAAREAEGVSVPKVLAKTNDEAAIIARLLDSDLDKVFTPRLAEVIKAEQERERRLAANDPGLDATQAELRRYAAQAAHLGVERSEMPPGTDWKFTPGGPTPSPRTPAGPDSVGGDLAGLPRPVAGLLGPGPKPVDAATLKAIRRNNRKAAASRGVRKHVDTEHYDPTPRHINTRQWYHGTGTKGLNVESLDGNMTMPDSLFGQGIYLTTDRDIARGYRDARTPKRGPIIGRDKDGYAIFGKEPKGEIYGARVNVKKVLDLEAPYNKGLGQVFHSQLNKIAKSFGHLADGRDPDPFIINEMRKAIEDGDVKTSADLYTTFRNALAEMADDYGWSKGDIWEYMQDLQGDLRRGGIDALTHVGGQRVAGSHPHQVLIVLDPANAALHGKPNPVQHFGPHREQARASKAPRRKVDEPPLKEPPPAGPLARRSESGPGGPLARREPDVRDHAGFYEEVPTPARHAKESDADYLARVKKAAAEAGLERPGYFVSQKRPRAGNADRAVGGARAIADPKRYTGSLFRTGREDTRAEVYEQGITRNIKRKFNWNLVAKNFDDHTFAWGKDKSVSWILDELDRRGLDPNSVALWNPRRYYASRNHAEADAATGTDLDRPTTDVTGRGEEPTVAGLDMAVDGSAVKIADIAAMARKEGVSPEDFAKTQGWSVVPKAIYDEIHADTRPSGVIARGYDIAKGKQSRILLGLSPAWLQFQVLSNALLSGMAGTGPVDFVKAQAWWNKLPDEQKAAIEPYIGTGAFHDSISQTKLGAARTRSKKVNDMIDGYRAMKTTPFMQHIGRGNPLDMLFRADAGQNNAFRTAVLYSQIKRDAYKRMGQNTKAMAGLQTRFMHSLNLGPQHIMDTIVKDQRSLERHAQHVNDFLGDYSTFTAAERRGFQRAVMFYGFLRFSLRFTFMTMPIKHPVMSAIIAQLGRLQVDEVRKLLGGDELPFALGKLYFTKGGKLKSVDLSRANPAMNAITNFRGPKDLLGFLPPIAGAVIDQAYAKSGFKQREWRVEGENQPRTNAQGVGVQNRVRIFLNQMLSLAAPYRTALSATQPGPKGDDSLLFSPRPTTYVDPQTVASIQASQQNLPATAGGRALQQLVPFIPRNDNAPELAASIRARNGEKTGSAPRSVAPAGAVATVDPETRLRQKISRQRSGANAEELRLRQKLRQR